MRAIVNTAPGRLEWLEVPCPEPGPGQVRVRTAACGICATDLVMIDGWERTGFPSIPGHEWAGWVDAVGPGVQSALVGQRCVADNVWTDGGEVGFEYPGGYGEYLVTEARNLYALPASLPLAQASLLEPLAVCLRGLHRWQTGDARAALVLGDGPIGLLLTVLLRRQGVEGVVLVGGRPARLALARELGATQTADYHQAGTALAEMLMSLPGAPFPCVAEASGAAAAAAAAVLVAARGGRVLIAGDYGRATAGWPWNHLLHRELTLVGTNTGAGAWAEAVQLAVSGAVPLGRLVSATYPATAFAEAVAAVRERRDLVKVVLTWE